MAELIPTATVNKVTASSVAPFGTYASAINAHIGPQSPILLNNFLEVTTDKHPLLIIQSDSVLRIILAAHITKYGKADNSAFYLMINREKKRKKMRNVKIKLNYMYCPATRESVDNLNCGGNRLN